jgi:ADP-heptose:LPS heptosyltransferase
VKRSALVHLASGIGNIVFATPLLLSLSEMDFDIDVQLDADYPDTAGLLEDWSVIRSIHSSLSLPPAQASYDYVFPAIPPFYWSKFQRSYARASNIVRRPPDKLFYQDEQDYYLHFARTVGYPEHRHPFYRLPIAPSNRFEVGPATVVIAPGCKTGEMALKRWPFFPELAECFNDVALVGTADDLRDAAGRPFDFPSHVRSYVDRLSLRDSAELMAAAGAVVGNDSGLCHIAGASGAPTLVIFGPTPHRTLGQFPDNVRVLRTGLPCEPCWFGDRFKACNRRIDCLTRLNVAQVERELRLLLGPSQEQPQTFPLYGKV